MGTSCGVNVAFDGQASRQTSQWYQLCSPTGFGATEVELKLYNFSANLMLFLLIPFLFVFLKFLLFLVNL